MATGPFSGYPGWQWRKHLLYEGLKAQDCWKVCMTKKSWQFGTKNAFESNRQSQSFGGWTSASKKFQEIGQVAGGLCENTSSTNS